MTAAAMETIGLDPEQRNPHPDDDTLGDHAEFFSSLSGQLSGLKVIIDQARESSLLEKELKDLKAELAAAKQRTADLGELQAAAARASEAMRRLGLAEWNQDPNTATVQDFAKFFGSLAGQLDGLKESLDETLEQEGKQVGAFVASRLLSRLHHRDPSFPVDAIHEKITPPAARKEAEAAVASHVAKLVEILKRQE